MRKAVGFLSAVIFSMAFGPHASGQREGWRNLLPILVNGKWGFIDRSGKIVIEPKFDAFHYWSHFREGDGLLVIQVGGKWGYCDQTGAIKIAPRFDEAREFSDGLAAVKVGDKWGFIDQTGRVVIGFSFN